MKFKLGFNKSRDWIDWFAWHPVILHSSTEPGNGRPFTVIWLEYIPRKHVYDHDEGRYSWRYQL